MNKTIRLDLSKSNNDFLQNLYNKINNIFNDIKLSTELNISKIVNKNKNENKHNNNRFISESVKKEFQKLNKIIIISNNEIYLKAYTYNSDNIDNTINTLKTLSYIILTIKKFVNNNKPINITYYLTNSQKKLPTNNNIIIGSNEVNSGSTTTYHTHTDTHKDNVKNGTIIIWRKEEILRVTIHELLHSLKADYNLYITKYLNNEAIKCFNLKDDENININEAYVEVNANILTSLFTALLSEKSEKSENNGFQYFLKNIEYERIFSIKQFIKIIIYQNEKYNLHNSIDYNWIFTSELKNKSKIFYQNSNVFSYYIIKCALLWNINEYIDFIKLQKNYPIFMENENKKNENKKNENKKNKNKKNENKKKFMKLILKSLKSKKLKDVIQKINDIDNDIIKDKTLKMTITSYLFKF